MDVLGEEILSLWAKFQEKHLRYIMVGGFATNLHGFERTTADLDIWIENSTGNRKILRSCLAELQIGDFEAVETMDFIPGWSSIQLNSGLELDIMTYLRNFPENTFEDCYQKASIAHIMEIDVPFLHINHLIDEKKKLGREKDRIDVLALEKIRDLNR